jgi:hypothetical protein
LLNNRCTNKKYKKYRLYKSDIGEDLLLRKNIQNNKINNTICSKDLKRRLRSYPKMKKKDFIDILEKPIQQLLKEKPCIK